MKFIGEVVSTQAMVEYCDYWSDMLGHVRRGTSHASYRTYLPLANSRAFHVCSHLSETPRSSLLCLFLMLAILILDIILTFLPRDLVVPWLENRVSPSLQLWNFFRGYLFDVRRLPKQKFLPGGQIWSQYTSGGKRRDPEVPLNQLYNWNYFQQIHYNPV